MGGPSAAIVLTELIALGARRAIRVGTCGALDPALALGELVIAREAICADGTSRALGAGERAAADAALTEALARAAPAARAGTVVSVDLFYERGPRRRRRRATRWRSRWRRRRCSRSARAAGRARRLPARGLGHVRRRAARARGSTTHALLEAAERMGRAALAALHCA